MVVKIFFGVGSVDDEGGVGFTGVWCEKKIITKWVDRGGEMWDNTQA